MSTSVVTQPRWAMLDKLQRARSGRYSWPQCSYCGTAYGITQHGQDCPVSTCELCHSPQCHGNGSGNGLCSICHHGFLPGWSRLGLLRHYVGDRSIIACQYKGCECEAVAIARRKPVCATHAERVKVNNTETLAQYVSRMIAERDAGRGWQRWRLVP